MKVAGAANPTGFSATDCRTGSSVRPTLFARPSHTTLAPGEHRIEWQGGDASAPLPGGVYFVRLSAAGRTEARRITLVP